ncbi:MAG TPA: DUF177 domain-containing protein [Dehalococcoidales bacterium]|nr:DUF177 domain-containing protein [Dehalococcoidales bacterium]
MQINVSQLLKAPIGTVRNYDVDGVVNIAGNDSRVQGEVKLMRTDRAILAKGTLHSEVEVACSRCLSLFRCPLALNVEEEYFPVIDVVSGASSPLPGEPSWFAIDERHILDLTEAIRQYALLAIPMKPLCHANCAGLCSNCGHNLNQGPCGCPSQKTDPRWSKLRNLTLANND